MKLKTLLTMCRYILKNSNGMRTDVFDFQKYYTLEKSKGEMIISYRNSFNEYQYIKGREFHYLIDKYQDDIIKMFNIVVNYKERNISENSCNDNYGMPTKY